MIQFPAIYTAKYQLDPVAKQLLDLIWDVRRTGATFKPGQRKLAEWLRRNARTIQRALVQLRKAGLIWWKRRGRKLTNVYYLAHHLWQTLTHGRRRGRQPGDTREDRPVTAEQAQLALAGIIAELESRRKSPPAV